MELDVVIRMLGFRVAGLQGMVMEAIRRISAMEATRHTLVEAHLDIQGGATIESLNDCASPTILRAGGSVKRNLISTSKHHEISICMLKAYRRRGWEAVSPFTVEPKLT